MRVVQSCVKVSGACMLVCEEQVFRAFYFIGNSLAFIIVFGAINTAVGKRDNFHRKSIEQAYFFDFNHFCTTVIHYSTFGAFQGNRLAARPAGHRWELHLLCYLKVW